MKDYKRDIPQLRFEEFTENWHKFRIEQISKVVNRAAHEAGLETILIGAQSL